MEPILAYAQGKRVPLVLVDAYRLSAVEPASNAGAISSSPRTAFAHSQHSEVTERHHLIVGVHCDRLLTICSASSPSNPCAPGEVSDKI